jgi:hypothetical protein
MKLVWTILLTALFLWLAQILLFLLLLVDSYSHIFLSLLVCFGAHMPDSAIQKFFSNILNAMLFPIRLVVQASTSSTFLEVIISLAMDSFVWGLVIGPVIYLASRFREKKTG